jgi:hypothetical protein
VVVLVDLMLVPETLTITLRVLVLLLTQDLVVVLHVNLMVVEAVLVSSFLLIHPN